MENIIFLIFLKPSIKILKFINASLVREAIKRRKYNKKLCNKHRCKPCNMAIILHQGKSTMMPFYF